MKTPALFIAFSLVFTAAADAAVFSNGAKERSEASLDSKGSIARFGANTSATVAENGSVSLKNGVMLVSTAEGFLRRAPVLVHTPQGDITVRGSALLAVLPGGAVKISCLEGAAGGNLGGESLSLHPGQLVMQREAGARDTVQVNLASLATSSPLLGQHFQNALPAVEKISREAVQQLQSLVSSGAVSLSGPSSSTGVQQISGTTLQISNNHGGVGTSTIEMSGAGLTLNIPANLVTTTSAEVTRTTSSTTGTSATIASMPLVERIDLSNVSVTDTTAGLVKSGSGMVQVGSTLGNTANLANLTVASSGSAVVNVTGANLAVSTNASLTLASGAVSSINGTGLLNVPTGPFTINLTTGTLTLTSQQAVQFQSGNIVVIGAAGTPLTPVNASNNTLTFSNN